MNQLKSILIGASIMAMSASNAVANSKQILQFKAGERISLITSHHKQGSEDKMGEYFKKVFPLATKHGFQPLGKLPIKKVAHGDYHPNNFLGIYKWASVESEKEFSNEASWPEYKAMRPIIWDELKIFTSTLKGPVALEFHEDKLYQVGTVWLHENEKKSFHDYRIAEAVEFKKLGAKYLILVPGEDWEVLDGLSDTPHYAFIIEWPSEQVRMDYYASKTFESSKHLFGKSVKNFESFITQFDFSGEKSHD